MAKKPARVVVDTNIFISYLIKKSFSQLDEYIRSGKIQLVFSEELLNEFLEVVARPKLRKYFSQKDILSLLDNIQNNAVFVEIHSEIRVCRDPKDNFLLALCRDGKAEYLITGDEDLLVLKKFKKTRILTYAEFVS